ncbi:hypothetical protein jhhlp_005457 [Lomentospora prolificans]|uniref:Hemerythrin-like domain-containing protein n=1 Tax=Lomentospora prolificans TaxID=41688 RepID=A0A2N3N6X5_9PEZI|nr:hypothetical protein jhhlp_005457 [Lomentospora prolificans]
MAPVYADHPFELLHTEIYKLPKGAKPDLMQSIASEMVLVHNIIIRGLNAIILQAPHIKPEDEIPFCHFITYWCHFLDIHHRGEEKHFFPGIERLTGKKGIMDVNIEQHDMFHSQMDDFSDYIKACIAGTNKFSRDEVVTRLDSFAKTLVTHLNDEIPTLLGLREYGDEKMQPILAVIEEEVKEGMGTMTLTGGFPWFMTCGDVNFEDGLWKNFPPGIAPKVAFFICRHFTFWIHADWWKFGPCDKFGNLQPLYAVPEEHVE